MSTAREFYLIKSISRLRCKERKNFRIHNFCRWKFSSSRMVLGSLPCLRRKYINLFIRIQASVSRQIYKVKQEKTIMLRRSFEVRTFIMFNSIVTSFPGTKLLSIVSWRGMKNMERSLCESSSKLCLRKIMCKLSLIKVHGLKKFHCREFAALEAACQLSLIINYRLTETFQQ